MAKINMTAEQLEAVEVLQEDVTDMAVKLGWSPVGPRGVNGTFAFEVYEHDAAPGQMKAMVPVDPDAATTFIMGSVKVSGKVAAAIFKDPTLDPKAAMAAPAKPKRKAKAASAAHPAAHPVPPTSAAHSEEAVPPIVPPTDTQDAAHSEESRVKTVVDKHREEMRSKSQFADESDPTEAVRDIISDSWSHVASPLTDAEILKLVAHSEVFWSNRLSNRTDSANVSASTNIPPYITGEVVDGIDMRCLHFLEAGAGFRSVSVNRIRRIK